MAHEKVEDIQKPDVEGRYFKVKVTPFFEEGERTRTHG